jgi:uncharacterized membrane protein
MGDTRLDAAASYLAGMLHRAGCAFDYLPSSAKVRSAAMLRGRKLVILSDFPADGFSDSAARALLAEVSRGCGLLMIGGWASFRGLCGHWERSPIAKALPVRMGSSDDRVNFDQAAFVRPAQAKALRHPILAGLPWNRRPPVVGGFNRVRAKPGASILLEVLPCRAHLSSGKPVLSPSSAQPLLVVSSFGAGRTAALAVDAAPHWVGPLVDWGSARVKARAPGANEVEVGSSYARFLPQLIRWTAGTGCAE